MDTLSRIVLGIRVGMVAIALVYISGACVNYSSVR